MRKSGKTGINAASGFAGAFAAFLFLSGYCSVSYELLWLRSLHLILGSDSLAVALVLAAFMAGLGAGSWWFGRLADRTAPLTLYRWLEFGIGAFALASPLFLSAGSAPYRMLFRLTEGSPALLLASKFLLGFSVLFIPTFLMGGTLPAAVRLLADRFEARGGRIALVYGINTLGACAAAVLVPFVFLPTMDQRLILVLTVAGNAAIFIGTFLVSPPAVPAATASEAPPALGGGRFSVLPATLFLTGFVSIALETVWNRLFSLHLTSSIYTFSLVLVIYLASVGTGSLLLGHARLKAAAPGRIFAATQLAITALILLHALLFDRIAWLQLWLLDLTGLGFTPYLVVGGTLIALMTAPINLLFGLSFPSALAFLTRDPASLGRRTGLLAALNTLGTTAASLAVTFAGYRWLGSRGVLLALAGLSLLTFFLLPRETRPAHWKGWTAGCAIALLLLVPMRWNLANFHLLLAQKPDWTLEMERKGELKAYRDGLKLLAFVEDSEAVVSVALHPDGHRNLFINGKPDASDFPSDLVSQYLCGHLPFLYRTASPSPEVLVLGLGSGSTTYAASLHRPARLETVEISPGVVECARAHFAGINNALEGAGPIRVEDGRNYLQNTARTFDIIISEPSNPWISGISNLFTQEFFRAVRARLNPGGVFCQWFYYYRMDHEYVRGLVATLHRTFPHVNVYNLTGDLMLVASDAPLRIDPQALLAPPPAIRELLKGIGIAPPEALMNFFLWDEVQTASLGSSLPSNRDGRSWLEFEAPKYIFSEYAEDNLRKMASHAPASAPPLRLEPDTGPGGSVFHEMKLTLSSATGLRPVSYRLVKRFYGRDTLIENAAWEVRLTDGAQQVATLICPILDVPLSVQNARVLLQAEAAGWPAVQPVTVTLPAHSYLALVSDGPPFRWTGAWNCEKSGRSFVFTVDGAVSVDSRDALLEALRGIRCHD